MERSILYVKHGFCQRNDGSALYLTSFLSLFRIKVVPLMMNSTNEHKPKKVYLVPSLRLITTNLETSFLASNLEPIGGGDDPDIDW